MADERPTWWDNQLPQHMTIGQTYRPAMEITDQESVRRHRRRCRRSSAAA